MLIICPVVGDLFNIFKPRFSKFKIEIIKIHLVGFSCRLKDSVQVSFSPTVSFVLFLAVGHVSVIFLSSK